MRRYFGLALLFITLFELAIITAPVPDGLLTNLGTRNRRRLEYAFFAVIGTASIALLTSGSKKHDPENDQENN